MKKQIITTKGVRFEEKKTDETISAEHLADMTKHYSERAMEATRDIQSLKEALDLKMNDDMLLFEVVETPKKAGFEFVDRQDPDLYEKMYYEHPYKGKVVKVGKIKSKSLKVKPSDFIYYDPSLKHNIFLLNNKKYMVATINIVIGTIVYKESLLTKFKRRILG